VRRICDHCKEPVKAAEEILRRLRIDPDKTPNAALSQGRGCKACGNTGYSGRLPIFEFLVIDQEMAERIVSNQSEAEIRAAARRKGYGGLLDNGAKAVLRGKTTAEEVLRVASTTDS
jgi:type II secretory ATPase GspE/PulE/Tfp pilus assembly ATPase PilB-like protein